MGTHAVKVRTYPDDDLCSACRHPDTAHDSDAFSVDGDPVSCECGCPDFVKYEDDPDREPQP